MHPTHDASSCYARYKRTMLRLISIFFAILLISCTDNLVIDSTTEASFEESLNQMKQGLTKAELFQLDFSLAMIATSALFGERQAMAEVADPKQYIMAATHGKSRQQIVRMAEDLVEKMDEEKARRVD